MREIIAAFHVSVDGFIEGPNGELDWVDTWADPFNLSHQIDTCILGAGMYQGYEQYWRAIVRNPGGILQFTGKVASPGEVQYAHFADRTPHFVLSTTMTAVDWPIAEIVRSIDEIRELKERPGKNIYAVGGATFVSSLLNADLVDQIRLVVHPVVLGRGKSLVRNIVRHRALQLTDTTRMASGQIQLTYRVRPGDSVAPPSNTTDETEIRELIENWAASVRSKDRNGIVARHDADVLLFDVPPPLQVRGLDAYWRSWERFFPWLDDHGVFDVCELSVTAGHDVAFCHGLVRCVRTDHGPSVRLTIGLRRIDGQWAVTHEHHSEPVSDGPGD